MAFKFFSIVYLLLMGVSQAWPSCKQSREYLHGDPHPKASTWPLSISSCSQCQMFLLEKSLCWLKTLSSTVSAPNTCLTCSSRPCWWNNKGGVTLSRGK